MSSQTKLFAGILLIAMVTIELGGTFLLSVIRGSVPGVSFDNQRMFSLFRAGHAHAGVLVILALVAMMYVDQTGVGDTAKLMMRIGFFAAPLLISGGFFGAAGPLRTGNQVGGLVALIYAGAVVLAVSLAGLGIALIRAR